jgi:hypothetical protein
MIPEPTKNFERAFIYLLLAFADAAKRDDHRDSSTMPGHTRKLFPSLNEPFSGVRGSEQGLCFLADCVPGLLDVLQFCPRLGHAKPNCELAI